MQGVGSKAARPQTPVHIGFGEGVAHLRKQTQGKLMYDMM